MAREVVIKCDICGSTHKVENRKLPMYRTFDATDGRTYYESPQIVFECIDICEECLSKCTNIHDERVQGYGNIVIENNPKKLKI